MNGSNAVRRVLVSVFSTTVLLLLPEAAALGQSSHPGEVVIPRMDDPQTFDGRIEDPAWEHARVFRLVQHTPNFGEAPSEETEVLIGHSSDYLYLACRCYDSRPPTSTTYRRNYTGLDNDWLALIIDTFNDNENALVFGVGPTGSRTDGSIVNDAAGSPPADFDWNEFWEAEAHVDQRGWFVEKRIPISSLRFEVQDDRVVMGLTVWRYVARTAEEATFPAIPPAWGQWSAWKPSQAQVVVFEDLEPQALLRVTPYALAGGNRLSVLNAEGTAWEVATEPAYDVGLDVKYGLADNLTLDLTFNTDFAQVEADDQEVNLDRFPLFFPEKRQFFQERASNFAFNFNERDRLFHSRHVGLNDGRPVRILGGARVVGRTGPWDIGILNMQTARESGLGPDDKALPAENFGIARFRRQILNPFSYVGAIGTSRIGRDGSRNVGYGVDGIFRAAGDDYLSFKWAQTFDDAISTRAVSLDAVRIQLRWERRSFSGLSYDLRYDRAGGDYRPAVGFELRNDYSRLGDRISYGWRPESGSMLERHQATLRAEATFRNADRSLKRLEVGPEWEFVRRGGGSLVLGLFHRVEDLPELFALFGELEIPAGRYEFAAGEVRLAMPGGMPLRASINLSGGGFYDGWIGSASLTPTWNVSPRVRVSGAYQVNRIGFPDRHQTHTSQIGRLRFEVTPNVRYSVQTFIQYNSLGEVAVGNVRFRYNPRDGTDFYVVFNDQLNTNRTGYNPPLPLSDDRTLLLKYSYTFSPGR
jgi:hypothetical protein